MRPDYPFPKMGNDPRILKQWEWKPRWLPNQDPSLYLEEASKKFHPASKPILVVDFELGVTTIYRHIGLFLKALKAHNGKLYQLINSGKLYRKRYLLTYVMEELEPEGEPNED